MKLEKDLNILILSHFFVKTISAGPPQDVRDFLLPRVKSIIYIEHPFPYNAERGEDTRSAVSVYENGVLKKQVYFPAWKGPDVIFYLKDVLVTQWVILKFWRRIDVCIALDNLNTIAVLFWRKLGIIKKLVYYTIDYDPRRFKNKLLNFIYHFIDKICCYYTDCIWILSERMMQGRKKKGVDITRCAASIIVPMGAHLSRINKLSLNDIERHTLVYVGTLSRQYGVQMILEILPDLKIKVPQVKFLVIGKGDYANVLQELAGQKGLSGTVEFKGFIEDNNEVEKILCRCAVGLAPYVPFEDNYIYYADPGKPKLYLGCGLPIIITRFPAIADEIDKRGAGIGVEYNAESLKEAILKLLKDDEYYGRCRENAVRFSQEFDTNYILDKALKQTICLNNNNN